jgi:hypothetical protein
MTPIDIISDSPTKHRIVFKTPESFRSKLTKLYEGEKDNLTIIDQYIGDFNKNNGDIINEYNYEVIDEKNFTVAVLFKHLFRALGTTRKYAKCNVSISDTQVNITFDSGIDIKLKSQGTCDHMPIRYLRASYVVVDDMMENTVEFETMEDVETYKCFTMLISTIKDGIINVIEDVEKIES